MTLFIITYPKDGFNKPDNIFSTKNAATEDGIEKNRDISFLIDGIGKTNRKPDNRTDSDDDTGLFGVLFV